MLARDAPSWLGHFTSRSTGKADASGARIYWSSYEFVIPWIQRVRIERCHQVATSTSCINTSGCTFEVPSSTSRGSPLPSATSNSRDALRTSFPSCRLQQSPPHTRREKRVPVPCPKPILASQDPRIESCRNSWHQMIAPPTVPLFVKAELM